MVRKIIILFTALFFGLITWAQEAPKELFEQGNSAYKESNYSDAMADYKLAIQNSAEPSAILHYNLANTYFKQGILGSAILHYEKALRIEPDHEKSRQNLDIANARIADKVAPSPSSAFYKRWTSLLQLFGADTFAIAALSMLLLSVLGFYLFITGKATSIRKSGFTLTIVFICLFSLTTYLSYAAFDVQNNRRSAIVLEAKVDAKTEPISNATTTFVLHEGTKISLINEMGDWVEITLTNGNVGWVEKEVLGII